MSARYILQICSIFIKSSVKWNVVPIMPNKKLSGVNASILDLTVLGG